MDLTTETSPRCQQHPTSWRLSHLLSQASFLNTDSNTPQHSPALHRSCSTDYWLTYWHLFLIISLFRFIIYCQLHRVKCCLCCIHSQAVCSPCCLLVSDPILLVFAFDTFFAVKLTSFLIDCVVGSCFWILIRINLPAFTSAPWPVMFQHSCNLTFLHLQTLKLWAGTEDSDFKKNFSPRYTTTPFHLDSDWSEGARKKLLKFRVVTYKVDLNPVVHHFHRTACL